MAVGTVARAHGLTGEVVVASESDDGAQRFRPGVRLHARLGGEARDLRVEHARPFQGRWLVKFDGFDERDAAERLRGAELRVDPESLPTLPDGVYYHHALVDCEVFTTAGARVGRVERVDGSGDHSVLVIRDAGHEVLIPLARALCPVIDPGSGRIVIDPPDGLLELNR